ncbi:MAG: hypothetical protein ACRCYY_14095 [Trueperaceae bacterium]
MYLERWDGKSWQSFGGNFPLIKGDFSFDFSAVRHGFAFGVTLDKSNNAVVAVSTGTADKITDPGTIVYRRNSAGVWTALGEVFNGATLCRYR